MRSTTETQLPPISAGVLGWFRWFIRGYLQKHFHSIALNRRNLQQAAICPEHALVVYANHAAWWDPLIAIHLAHRLFPGFRMYAPIDAVALAKYPMFRRMGFFGVERQSRQGASCFLSMSTAIIGRSGCSLWLTPEGRFSDVRDQSAPLMPGLAHLAWKAARATAKTAAAGASSGAKSAKVWILPVAIEYPFWEERKPELLVWFGPPIDASTLADKSKSQITQELTHLLRSAQRELAQASIGRVVAEFEVISGGKSGAFLIYDCWRRLVGRLLGREVSAEHGDKLHGSQPPRC